MISKFPGFSQHKIHPLPLVESRGERISDYGEPVLTLTSPGLCTTVQ
jgi:hypothetical protein